jgi:drug/metabolite transporter (DMT)-like permease
MIEMRQMATEKRMPVSLLMERILSVITVLGLICLCIGVLLYVAGRASDLFTVAQVGVFLLLIGAVLIGMRILYWIMEELVGRGLDSMGKQNALQTILEIQLKILPKVLKAYQCLHTVRAL